MIKCISYWTAGPLADWDLDKTLKLVKASGIEGIELTVGLPDSTEPVKTNTTKKACSDIRKKVDAAGIKCETVASGMSWALNPVSDSKQIRAKSIKAHKAALERASYLGCDSLLFVPGAVGGPITGDKIRYDHAVERAREAVKELLETAEKVGVDLLLENVWNGFFLSPLELRDFVDSFKSKRLGVYFDVGNVMGYHQYPPHWIELLGKRIRRVHIKDYKASVGNLDGFVDLMAGDVPWKESFDALRAIGYDKTVVAEMMPADPAILERTKAGLDKIWSL